MKETSKAMERRMGRNEGGEVDWKTVFTGSGIDIGPGDDPLAIDGVTLFDKEQGDANRLDEYFPSDHFNYLHASQSLEHMHDPLDALLRWIKVLKPGGWLVITVPDWCLYEGMIWPSRFNGDHKSSWSGYLRGSPAPIHVYVPDLLRLLRDVASFKDWTLVDTNYNYSMGARADQTIRFEDRVEAFIEILIRKK